MQQSELDQDTLRRLAELAPGEGQVLSVYLDLSSSEFSTAAARATAVHSLVDEAGRRAKELDLTHDELAWLRADIDQVGSFLESEQLPVKGAAALAVFAASGSGLFEVVTLPRQVPSQVEINGTPFIEPLADLASAERWAVLLVDRREGRLLRGSRESLSEVERFSELVHASPREGTGTQSRDQQAVDEESRDHLRRTAEVLFEHSKRRPFDRLVLACPEDLHRAVSESLHPYLRELVVGHIDAQVEHSTPSDVQAAALPLIEAEERRREQSALERLAAGAGTGERAAVGLEAVLAALAEWRVELLLYEQGYEAAGVRCERCGWLGTAAEECPVDGGAVAELDDVMEAAIELTVRQSAEVVVVREGDQLAEHGSIGAVLRF